MGVGTDMVSIVKTNIKVFCKYAIENLTKYLPGGSYFVLKRNYSVPGYRPPTDIEYNYNARKVLSFISTKDEGTTNAGITYLYKYYVPFLYYHSPCCSSNCHI